MRIISVSVGLLILAFVHVPDVFGCAAGYESPESLVKRARLILELEPISVTNAPPPEKKPNDPMWSDNHQPRKNGKATVKVVSVVKGKCGLKAFDLVGGPYYSCAPYPVYVPFERGRRVFLILDQDLPVSTKTGAVTWRCRVFGGEKKQLLALMQNARDAWRESLKRHREADPDAMAEAERLLKASRSVIPARAIAGSRYAVLACLSVLLMDPDRVPASIPTRGGKNTGPEMPPMTEKKGVCYTLLWATFPLPESLMPAMERLAKEMPTSVTAFNRKLLEILATKTLLIPAVRAGILVRDNALTNSLQKCAFSPYDCDIRVDEKDKSARDLRSLQLLIGLADDEPDTLVWRTFGLRSDADLNTEMFANYIEKNADRDYSMWPRLRLLLAVPHKKIAPIVKRYLDQEQNLSRFPLYMEFFARIRQYRTAYSMLAKLEEMVRQDVRTGMSEEERKGYWEWAREQLDGFEAVVEGDEPDNAEFLSRLGELRKKVDRLVAAP